MQRLSGLDAAFLYLETPSMHMHVCLAAVLDPATMPQPYSFKRMRSHIASRVPIIPPFRRVLHPTPLQVHHPVWVDDEHLDIERHVHRVKLGTRKKPADLHALGHLAGTIASVPLDRSRPLWDLSIVEWLEDGRLGLIVKVHHSAMDGTAGLEILYSLFDVDPDPVPDGSTLSDGPPEPAGVGQAPPGLELLTTSARERLRASAGIGALVRRTGEAVTAIARRRSTEVGPSGGTPLTAPATPFNGAIVASRELAFARVPLADMKAVRAEFGVTVNDVVLALCARTLRRYLKRHDALPDTSLLASCPVSVRTEDQAGHFGNRVSVMFTRLPTELDDPVDCLRVAAASASAAKSDQRELGPSLLGDWAELADPRGLSFATDLISRFHLGDRMPPVHNVVVSNLAGPSFPVYLGGARLEQAYPMGPVLEGAGLNITVLSYRDMVDIGFIASPNLVPDLWDLAADVEPAFAELVDLI
ncbi:MAG: WS/DGAT/MGAT family O-acyltransferase [Acidimicrobiales bacterium]